MGALLGAPYSRSKMAFMMALIGSVAARPLATGFLGHAELAGATSKYDPDCNRSMTLNFTHSARDGRYTKMEYFAKLRHPSKGNVLFLDAHARSPMLTEEAAMVESIRCAAHGRIELKVREGSSILKLHKFLHQGSIISSGGHHWGCQFPSGALQSVQHRVRSVVLYEHTRTAVVAVDHKEVHLTEFFETAKMRFSTNRFPKSHSAASRAKPTPLNARYRRLGSHLGTPQNNSAGFFDWIGHTWNSVVHVASEVADVTSTIYHAVKAVAKGTFSGDIDDSLGRWAWNIDAQGYIKEGKIDVDAQVACFDCYASLDVSLNLHIDIQNYHFDSLAVWVEGSAEASGGNPDFRGDASSSNDKLVDTINFDPFNIQLGPVPVIVTPSMPIHLGYNFDASWDSDLNATFDAWGDVKFGLNMHCDGSMVEDADSDPSNGCTIHPISEHTFKHQGTMNGLSYGAQSSLVVYVLPVPVMQIEFIGGPAVGFKIFLEFAADADSGYDCSPKRAALPAPRLPGENAHAALPSFEPPKQLVAPASPNGAVKTTLNIGIQVSVSAEIKISFGAASPTIYQKKFPNTAVFSKKYGILTGCFSVAGMQNGVGLTPWVENAVHKPAGTVTIRGVTHPNAAVQNLGMTPGTIWTGKITQNGCLPGAPQEQDIVMQLTKYDPQTAFWGGSTTWLTQDSSTGDDGACVFQSSWSMAFRGVTNTLEKDPGGGVDDFQGCTAASASASWMDRFFADFDGPDQPGGWTHITGHDVNNCLQLSASSDAEQPILKYARKTPMRRR